MSPLARPARRSVLVGAFALALAACGAPTDTGTTGPDTPATSGGAFPVTIQHALGSTTLEKAPTRVVTVGWSDQDAVLALGVVPVGTTEWFDEQPGAVFPWATDKLSGTTPQIVATAGEINFEKVAALRPDLILALYEGLEKSSYDKLAAIAPTVAHSKDYDAFGAPWQDMTVTVGRALGRQQQAEELVAAVEAKLAAVATAHPEWAQQTLLVGATAEAGKYQVFSPQDPKVRFFANLGFRTEPSWLAGRVLDNVADVSAEEAQLLDVDRLVWTSDPALRATLDADPIYGTLAVVREGRVDYFDYTTPPFPGAAITFNTVLSIPYAIDQAVPVLSRTGN